MTHQNLCDENTLLLNLMLSLCHEGAQTAWDILRDEQTLTHITTSCEELDTILGGGINCKEVTEIG